MITEIKEKRGYNKRKRADSQDLTRLRIVEATMQLHEKLGPRNTSIKAIAELAGVQRLTVYRHFPTETDVFNACTSHWIELNPPPDPSPWGTIADPLLRTVAALSEVYTYFTRTQGMWRVSYRDVSEVEALHAPLAQFDAYLESVAYMLVAAFPEDKQSLVAPTLNHAATFQTWETLNKQALSDSLKATTVASWLNGLLSSKYLL